VIDALEFLGVTAIGRHHHGAAMGALIDLREEIVAGIAHLAFMADKQPGHAENALHLQFENRRVGI
jgi:hypothetical protein